MTNASALSEKKPPLGDVCVKLYFNTQCRNPLCAGSLKGCKLQSCKLISIYNHICLLFLGLTKGNFQVLLAENALQFVMLCERSALFLDFLSAVSFL